MALRYDDDEAVNSDDEVIDEVHPESDSDAGNFPHGIAFCLSIIDWFSPASLYLFINSAI